MKRVSLNLFLLLFFALFANAQESKYRKPVVVVNYFNKSSEIKSGDCELARNAVLSSLSNYPRLRVIDVETESSIDQETKRRLKEEALADELARSGHHIKVRWLIPSRWYLQKTELWHFQTITQHLLVHATQKLKQELKH